MSKFFQKTAVFFTIIFSGASYGQAVNCGSIQNAFGPFDYRIERGNNLYLVEMAHFTPAVESLIKGNTGYIGGDLDYTLRAFPNHHRALMSVMRYGEKLKTDNPPNMNYSVECYFERALRFKSDDTITRIIYSMYLAKKNRKPEAIEQLDKASLDAESSENPLTHYNLGLNYFDLKEYDKSLNEAYKAYELGYIQPELKDRLKGVGKWTEVQTPSVESASTPQKPAD